MDCLFQHYASENPSGSRAEAARREVVGIVGVCAYGRNGYAAVGYSRCAKLLAVALFKVDVPFIFAAADCRHVETGFGKLAIHLVAYFKCAERDAWTYYYLQLFRV